MGLLKPTPRMLAHMRWHRVGRSRPARLGAAARLRVLAHMRWLDNGRCSPGITQPLSDGMAGGVSMQEREHAHSMQRVRVLAVAD